MATRPRPYGMPGCVILHALQRQGGSLQTAHDDVLQQMDPHRVGERSAMRDIHLRVAVHAVGRSAGFNCNAR